MDETRFPAIREWARANGYQVTEHGRIPASLVEAYTAASNLLPRPVPPQVPPPVSAPHTWLRTVSLDYGQFYLRTTAAGRLAELMPALERAMAGEGIAQDPGALVVLSPHQNNFALALTIELLLDEPAADLDEWQEAFQAQIEVDEDGMYYESPTLSGEQFEVPAGQYRLLITGRGFVAHGWPGSTEPGDVWRFRLWPCEQSCRAARLKAWPGPA